MQLEAARGRRPLVAAQVLKAKLSMAQDQLKAGWGKAARTPNSQLGRGRSIEENLHFWSWENTS